ncbi:gluconate 2-dehydrogenase subunit 3 family protein [Aquipluma nitroreducens]|nr:gluconate 2-dehydrogenase subunit 3 family protein [Aquipluma nitroreducens]
MKEPWNNLSRRRFMQLAALGSGGVLLFSQCSKPNSLWRFFTNAEAQLMDAVADQLIPPDEWPGGRESGVTNFIDKQLVGPYVRFQEKYRKGLKAVQNSCETMYFMKFEKLSSVEQISFIEKMEAGELSKTLWTEVTDREFFNLIRDHSMQAFYGSSRQGGNKNNISYKMLQLDYPLIIGQNRYKT